MSKAIDSLKSDFNWMASGALWAARGAALYCGFFAIDAFLDYGMIHSDGFMGSELATLAHQFLEPLTEKIPDFLASGMGESLVDGLEWFLSGIHSLFGIEGVIGAENISMIEPTGGGLLETTGASSGIVESTGGAFDAGETLLPENLFE